MDSFRFAHPEYFYIFLVLPALVFLFLFNRIIRNKKLKSFGQLELLEQLMPSLSTGRPVVKFGIWLLAITCLITALAQPQFGSKLTLTKRKGVELIIALDVSNSMKAQDIKPNRLERAKRAIAKLTDRLKKRQNRIGGFCRSGLCTTAYHLRLFIRQAFFGIDHYRRSTGSGYCHRSRYRNEYEIIFPQVSG